MPHTIAAPSSEAAVAAPDSGLSPSQQATARLLDDPQEWSSFGRPAGPATPADPSKEPTDFPAWDSHVVLEGMHCAACALTIEDALRAVPGVEKAEVSAATRRARVTWRHEQVLPSQWMEAVRRAGYQALPARDAFARERRQAESRRALWRWLVAGFCMMQVMMYAWPAYVARPGDLSQEMETLLRWASWVISLPVVLFCCGPFFSSALRDIRQRRVSMDLPVALGMLITFVISSLGTFDPSGPFGEEVFYDSLTMFVFFMLSGRWLELRLRDRTAGALEAVMNRLPDAVLRENAAGHFERVATRRLRAGDLVRVLSGEAFPADGTIVRGRTHADEALLTGESTPVLRAEGDSVTAGSYNLDAVVDVRVDGVGADTRFAQIVGLMESASLQKPRLAQLAEIALKLYWQTGNFTVLHMVTGSRAAILVGQQLPGEWQAPWQTLMWQAVAAAYITVGAPRLQAQRWPDTTGLDWAQVLPLAIESLDDHVIKLVHCCWREQAHSPHYLAVAARAVGLLDAASHPQRP